MMMKNSKYWSHPLGNGCDTNCNHQNQLKSEGESEKGKKKSSVILSKSVTIEIRR